MARTHVARTVKYVYHMQVTNFCSSHFRGKYPVSFLESSHHRFARNHDSNMSGNRVELCSIDFFFFFFVSLFFFVFFFNNAPCCFNTSSLIFFLFLFTVSQSTVRKPSFNRAHECTRLAENCARWGYKTSRHDEWKASDPKAKQFQVLTFDNAPKRGSICFRA